MISNVKKSATCSSFSWCTFIRIVIKIQIFSKDICLVIPVSVTPIMSKLNVKNISKDAEDHQKSY